MVIDDERRRVVARLREMSDWSGEVDCAEWGERVLNLLYRGGEDCTDGEYYERLADLIEPVERMCLYYDADTNHCGCYDTRLIDRDALLALADEMTVEKGDIWRWSSRIREALGVDDD